MQGLPKEDAYVQSKSPFRTVADVWARQGGLEWLGEYNILTGFKISSADNGVKESKNADLLNGMKVLMRTLPIAFMSYKKHFCGAGPTWRRTFAVTVPH
jgi:hypothetical protein